MINFIDLKLTEEEFDQLYGVLDLVRFDLEIKPPHREAATNLIRILDTKLEQVTAE